NKNIIGSREAVQGCLWLCFCFLPLPAQHIRTLYYGVPKPPSPDAGACRELFGTHGLAPGGFTVAIFGRIEPGKGQHLLIAAVAELVREGRDIQALVIGHAMREAYLVELRARVESAGLEQRIRFAGFHPEPPAIMGCFDAVVLASKEETFGLVLAEAMRAGTAVIGSRAGGVPEIIDAGKTGLLFTTGDAGDLARGLRQLLGDPELRQRLARAGEAFADRQFSEERHFARLTEYLSGAA
ncbi:MAG TPA: glycosyltransferase family 1 protein, partial [Chromatiales bacterium]|nr:glycosyltransferase family 1 protein [Chromatiales bacterium]